MDKIRFIHNTVIIDSDAEIGNMTRIWHFSHISSGAVIGNNCTIGQNVFIGKDVSIGNGCKIQNNVSIFSGVVLEDDVFVGPSVTFTNVKIPRAFIDRKKEFRQTYICRGASIGANATIVCGLTIGKYALVGAGSVVTHNIGDFEVVFGNPAEYIGMIDKDGTKIKR